MKKVIVGMSGGVDSSVAAAKLIEQGFEVIGVTARVWENSNPESTPETESEEADATEAESEEADTPEAESKETDTPEAEIDDAKKVCELLGIEHHVVDLREEFKCAVMDYFVTEYCHVRTPNPCNMCNRHIKWRALTEAAEKYGADYVATGHYARIIKLTNGRFSIANAESAVKDQTYALCFLTQEQLSKTLMPLGDYTKEQVREEAKRLGLSVAEKKDSQDICFIPDKDYRKFIDGYMEENSDRETVKNIYPDYLAANHVGNFVDEYGNVLGAHRGLLSYTYGQRRGLGVSAKTRLCVIDMNETTGNITLAEDEKAYSDSCICRDVSWMSIEKPCGNIKAFTKIRYAHKGENATLSPMEGNRVKVTFDNPVRAITPGQPIVFYENDYILGAGIIDK